MSKLEFVEKNRLETLFGMKGGYVLDFSDRSFAEFFVDFNIDIHDDKYCEQGTSKAKKLREFWKIENDYLVGKVVQSLIHIAEDSSPVESKEESELIEDCKKIATRLLSGQVDLDSLKQTATRYDAKHLAMQIKRAGDSVQEDPVLAIGTAKEIIETCCKTILAERGNPVTGTPNMPKLIRETLKQLKLIPENINEEARGSDVIKRLLQNLGTVADGLAELRGLYGTGHGKHGKTKSLSARHAKLAVGAAATLARFLFDTHEETK